MMQLVLTLNLNVMIVFCLFDTTNLKGSILGPVPVEAELVSSSSGAYYFHQLNHTFPSLCLSFSVPYFAYLLEERQNLRS